jgi:hypothetical protein
MTKYNSNIDLDTYARNADVRWVQKKVDEAEAGASRVREKVAQRGYRLMHRRNGQYWVMFAQPMTLPEIETWVDQRRSN